MLLTRCKTIVKIKAELTISNPKQKIKLSVLLMHGVCEMALTPCKSKNLQPSSISENAANTSDIKRTGTYVMQRPIQVIILPLAENTFAIIIENMGTNKNINGIKLTIKSIISS